MSDTETDTEIEDLSTYYENLIEQINNNKMDSFWILCDVKDFTPIKKDTKQKDKMKKYVKSKPELWKRQLAGIDLLDTVNPKKINKKNSDEEVFTIKIYLYNINDEGNFDYDDIDTWTLTINYTKAELNKNRPSYEKLIDNIKQMVKLAEKRKITTDFTGITYTQFISTYSKLKKNKSKRGSKRRSKRE